jgi:hypothetical protein
MSLILSGTDGLSDIDGTAATPAIRGTDTNTGIFFGADIIGFSEGGAEVARFNASGNLGIGTASPIGRLTVLGGNTQISPGTSAQEGVRFQRISGAATITGINNDNNAFNSLAFFTSGTEAMRVDSANSLLVGTTTYGDVGTAIASPSTGGIYIAGSGTGSTNQIRFANANGVVGSITTSGSTTTYATSSDYRLKENIAPMTGALAKVELLKPVTYNWKAGGSSQGFIAHELAEVVPDCVTGEKDAVDADGNIRAQGIDTSFLVATLTAAIQELKATVDAQAARIAALENPPAPIES